MNWRTDLRVGVSIINYITARKPAAEKRRTRASRLEGLGQSPPAARAVHAADGRWLRCNAHARERPGIPESQTGGKTLRDAAWRFVRGGGTRRPVEEYPAAQVLAPKAPLMNFFCGIRRACQPDVIWTR